MTLYHRRLFSTVALFGIATIFLAVPELSILDATGYECEIEEDVSEITEGKSRLKCAKGKVTSLDFFEMSACFDPNHGSSAADAAGVHPIDAIVDGGTAGPATRSEQVESYVLYDHCTAPSWPFNTHTYSNDDFKLHHDSTGYIGKDRFVGGARLAMMKRAWVMLTSLGLFGFCVLLRFLTFVGIIKKSIAEMKGFRSFQNLCEVLMVIFGGLYIFSALSTLYQMRDCAVPDHFFDASTRVNLGHMFTGANDEASPGGETVLWSELQTMGTQNKRCGGTQQTLSEKLDGNEDDLFCCNNSAAHFINSKPGKLLENMTTVNGETYLQAIIIAVFLFFLPLVSFVGTYFAGYPLLDTIGSGLLFGASIQLLVFSVRGVETGRCGDPGEQLASLGTSGGQGGFTSGQGMIFLSAGILLLIYSSLHFMRSLLKFNPESLEPELMKSLLHAVENAFGGMFGHSYALILTLLLAISVGTVIGTNGTDMCNPYDPSGPGAKLIEGSLLCMYLFSILFAISGSVFHELIFDLPVFGSIYSKLQSSYASLMEGNGKEAKSASSMGYAVNAPMHATQIKLTTFN